MGRGLMSCCTLGQSMKKVGENTSSSFELQEKGTRKRKQHICKSSARDHKKYMQWCPLYSVSDSKDYFPTSPMTVCSHTIQVLKSPSMLSHLSPWLTPLSTPELVLPEVLSLSISVKLKTTWTILTSTMEWLLPTPNNINKNKTCLQRIIHIYDCTFIILITLLPDMSFPEQQRVYFFSFLLA